MDVGTKPGQGRSPEGVTFVRETRGQGRSPEGVELRETPEGTLLRVRVQPRASRDALGGERDGALVVRLTAPPVDGAANKALLRFLARALGVAPSALRIARGAKGRDKQVSVAGLDAAALRTRLAARREARG